MTQPFLNKYTICGDSKEWERAQRYLFDRGCRWVNTGSEIWYPIDRIEYPCGIYISQSGNMSFYRHLSEGDVPKDLLFIVPPLSPLEYTIGEIRL